MTKILFIFFLSLVLGGLVQAKPRHYIFGVHGIGGGDQTFLAMGPALEKHLGEMNPNYEYKFIFAPYSTGDDDFNTYLFAQTLQHHIEGAFADAPIQPDDKISIVAHSQGGLVSYIWYIKGLLEDPSHPNPYAQRLDAFITLGTPYWGSKIAFFAHKLKDKWWGKKILKKMSMGQKELLEMVFGSETAYRFRRRTIEIDKIKSPAKIFKYRPLAVAGVFSKSDSEKYEMDWKNPWKSKGQRDLIQRVNQFFEMYGFGDDRHEGDGAVILPSARMDFIYGEALNAGYTVDEVLGVNQFRKTDYLDTGHGSPFIVLEAPHAFNKPEEVYDIVAVPRKCVDIENCDHSSYRFVLKHIANCDSPEVSCVQEKANYILKEAFKKDYLDMYYKTDLLNEMRGFSLEINIELPLGYAFKKDLQEAIENHDFQKFIQFNFVNKPDKGSFDVFNFNQEEGLLKTNEKGLSIYIARSLESFSRIVRARYHHDGANSKKFLNVHLTGVVRSDHLDRLNGYSLPFRISLPQLKPRQIEARIAPSYSTFVDVKLEK